MTICELDQKIASLQAQLDSVKQELKREQEAQPKIEHGYVYQHKMDGNFRVVVDTGSRKLFVSIQDFRTYACQLGQYMDITNWTEKELKDSGWVYVGRNINVLPSC